jgi:hypothetical protein
MAKRATSLTQFALGFLIVASYVMAAWGAVNSGVTWDEKYHVAQLERAIKPVPYTNVYGAEVQVREVDQLDFVYGLAYQYLGHAANVIRGNEQLGSPAVTAESYAVRHLVGVGLSVVAGIAVFVSARVLTGSTTASLFGWAVLALWPTWLGHSFTNPKDFPAAVGWTLFSTGLVLLAKAFYTRSRRFPIIGVLTTGVGFAFAMGTRIALWLPLMVVALLMTLILVGISGRKNETNFVLHARKSQALAPLLGAGLGVFLFFISHPHLVVQARGVFYDSVEMSSRYHQLAFVLTYGQVVISPESMQRIYLPLWFWAITPLALLTLIVAALVWFFLSLRKARSFRLPFRSANYQVEPGFIFVAMTPILLQAFGLVAMSIILNTPSYDAQRQHLYALPALAILAGVGVSVLWRFASGIKSISSSRTTKGGIVLLALALCVEFLFFNVRLLPYNYAYITPVATVGREPDLTWETDYWGLSVRESFQKTPPGSRVSTWGVSSSWEPFAHLASGAAATDLRENQFYWIKSQRNDFGVPKPGSCEQIDKIDRTVLGKTFTMSRTYICTDVQN